MKPYLFGIFDFHEEFFARAPSARIELPRLSFESIFADYSRFMFFLSVNIFLLLEQNDFLIDVFLGIYSQTIKTSQNLIQSLFLTLELFSNLI